MNKKKIIKKIEKNTPSFISADKHPFSDTHFWIRLECCNMTGMDIEDIKKDDIRYYESHVRASIKQLKIALEEKEKKAIEFYEKYYKE
ncbi:MAG: hypothetical protein ACOCP8_08820 [archaeon]